MKADVTYVTCGYAFEVYSTFILWSLIGHSATYEKARMIAGLLKFLFLLGIWLPDPDSNQGPID